MTKQTGASVSEREREKSILAATTVEHAPIWRPGRLGGIRSIDLVHSDGSIVDQSRSGGLGTVL